MKSKLNRLYLKKKEKKKERPEIGHRLPAERQQQHSSDTRKWRVGLGLFTASLMDLVVCYIFTPSARIVDENGHPEDNNG